MKDQVKNRVWTLVGINAVVLIVVLGLAYGAGARSSGLSLRDFSALPQTAGFELMGAAFLVLAASLFLLLQLGSKVVKPTRDLVEYSEKLMAGDYEARAEITQDDFGVIAENWNRASEALAQSAAIKAAAEALNSELPQIEEKITQFARGEFSGRARAEHAALVPIAEAINLLVDNHARRMDRVRAATSEIAGYGNQVLAAAAEMASTAAQQERAAGNAAAAVADLSSSTQQVSTHAESATLAARKALEISDQGTRAVRDTAEGMQRIRASMQTTAAKIKSLGDRSLEIYEIINLIHETNLLALNAVVESTRGGQAGQSLDVLSAEMRKLADHSRTATREIVTLLKSIQAESNEAVAVMEQANRVAETGSRLTEQANRAFVGVAGVLRQTSELAEAIAAASRNQVAGTERVALAVQEIAANMRQNSSKGRQSAKIVEQVVRSSEQLAQAVAPARPAAGPTVVKAEKPEAVSAAVVGRA